VVERPLRLGVPEIRVSDARAAMAPVAARFYGDPTARLQIVGVTGTDGKTTTACLVRVLLEAGHRQTGLLGTIGKVIGGIAHPSAATTPRAIELQQTCRAMVQAGDVACAMEVSSHALALNRVDSVRFAAAIFTNLTRDHLDFHGTMDDYFAAKRRLFIDAQPGTAIINVDDPHGARLAAELEAPVTFALERRADYRALDVQTGADGTRFKIATPDGELKVRSRLRGRFNVYNVLGALAAVRALGVPLDAAAMGIETAPPVPGRFEPVDMGQDFAVLVDYAHTPDSLAKVLSEARALVGRHSAGKPGRLHVVFGCGGGRDRGKRPLMGEIAARLADRVIVTTDNPRSEDPEAIISEILAGAGAGAGDGVECRVGRRAAIAAAISGAEPGDVLVIAGKGHEPRQELRGGHTVLLHDVTIARELLGGDPGRGR
jgi:UDP-N-acetylmuramoyl-L-alanyl-D-glutamate--2,6-diaminopimelate ligase